MVNSVLYTSIPTDSSESKAKKSIRWLVGKMAIATLILMAVGAATRVMNAGLACPDWPLCYGQVIPTQQMNLQVFLEWFHRLDAALIGLSAIALVIMSWWNKSQLPKWLPFTSTFALALIVFQGILGGLTVTQLLRFDIVTAHLATALLFFSTLIIIGCLLTPNQGLTNASKFKWIGLSASILVYIQCLLGGLVGSRWALHQCFTGNQLCLVMNSHIIGVFPATIATLSLFIWVWRTPALSIRLRRLANWAGKLVFLQIILGVATFYFRLQVEPLTITHHTLGASLFGTLVAFTVFAWRETTAKA